jgi:hypothetical protein
MTDDGSAELETLRDGLKRVAVGLKEAGIAFALAGGYAAWVHGAPEPSHDVDFVIREQDAGHAREELRRRGFEVLEPPEDWLFKVQIGDVVVDVLFRSQDDSVERLLDRAQQLAVLSVEMPVLSATDVTAEKLLALDEHYCDLAAVLPVVRALREQVDWEDVRRRTAGAPFAETVLFLLDRLEIAPASRSTDGA